MMKQSTVNKDFLLKASDYYQLNRDSEDHFEIMETYDPGPAIQKKKSHIWEHALQGNV